MEAVFDFIAGWIGGCAGLFVGHPLDTVKVRQQTMPYASMRHCIAKTFRHEGVYGFYKGLAFPFVSNGLINCIFFGFYGNFLRFIIRNDPEVDEDCPRSPLGAVFVAGCLASVAQAAVITPIELVKVKLQVQTDRKQSLYRGPIHCMRLLYRAKGIPAWYRGLVAQLVRDIPSSGVYMFAFEAGVRLYKDTDEPPSPRQIMLSGGVAGVASWVVIMPFDVIKSRIQADDPVNPRYRGMFHCASDIYRNEGLATFGKGFWAMTIRAFPTNSVIFLFYWWTMDVCNRFALWEKERRSNT